MAPARARLSFLMCLLLPVLSATAQKIRVGSLEGNGGTFASVPTTIIDWSRPAGDSGVVTTASVRWTDATTPCDDIFFVRFYVIPSNGSGVVMLAERGPFRAVNGINTVALTPFVTVSPETYIGIRRVEGPESCGRPYGTFTREAGRALMAEEDFTGGPFTTLQPVQNYRLQAQASDTPSVRVSTVPVVGSAAGGFGSYFRTALTLANPTPDVIRGKLVMRQAGRAGGPADPSLDFVIPARGTLSYPDVVEAMGQSGLGSLDILTIASPTPIASARVFNDAGAAGTSGFFEDAVPAGEEALGVAQILIPSDLTNYRLNVGIRTISETTVNVRVFDSAGATVQLLSKTYPAHFFEQISVAAFTENVVPAGGRIEVYAYGDEFIAYGAVTDNRTNDPSMRIGLD